MCLINFYCSGSVNELRVRRPALGLVCMAVVGRCDITTRACRYPSQRLLGLLVVVRLVLGGMQQEYECCRWDSSLSGPSCVTSIATEVVMSCWGMVTGRPGWNVYCMEFGDVRSTPQRRHSVQFCFLRQAVNFFLAHPCTCAHWEFEGILLPHALAMQWNGCPKGCRQSTCALSCHHHHVINSFAGL